MSEHLNIPPENKHESGSLKQLKQNKGWSILCEILNKNIEEVDGVINTVGGDKKPEFSKRDIAVIKKQVYQEVLDLPDSLINQLEGTGQQEQEQMDAYEDDEEDAQEQMEDDFMDDYVDPDY